MLFCQVLCLQVTSTKAQNAPFCKQAGAAQQQLTAAHSAKGPHLGVVPGKAEQQREDGPAGRASHDEVHAVAAVAQHARCGRHQRLCAHSRAAVSRAAGMPGVVHSCARVRGFAAGTTRRAAS